MVSIQCTPGKVVPAPKGYFVSAVMMSPTEFRTKKAAIQAAKETGGFVYRKCECGCGRPAGKPILSFNKPY